MENQEECCRSDVVLIVVLRFRLERVQTRRRRCWSRKWRGGETRRRRWRLCGRPQRTRRSAAITYSAMVIKRKKNHKFVSNNCDYPSIIGFVAGKRHVRPYYFEFISHVLLHIALNRIQNPNLSFRKSLLIFFVFLLRRLRIVGRGKPLSICSPKSSKDDLMIITYDLFNVCLVSEFLDSLIHRFSDCLKICF